MRNAIVIVIALAVLALVTVFLRADTRTWTPVEVQRSTGAIALDGETDEPDWQACGHTGTFVTRGGTEAARPYSEAWILHDDRTLYLALYAADQDLRRGSDVFEASFVSPRDGARVFMNFSIDGQLHERMSRDGDDVPGWKSGVRFAVDFDGTLDDPADEDEEWIVEAAIPLAALGADPSTREIRASLSRCDVPKDGIERCGEWGVGRRGEPAGIFRLLP